MAIWITALIISTYIIVFVAGMISALFIFERGYVHGWKASYQIREDPEKGLFKNNGEPDEFAVLDEQEKEES